MRRFSSLLLVTSFLASGALTPAFADEHHGRGEWHGDIHRFHERDYDHWRGGHWYHGFHGDHDGWWWTVSGYWYYYPAPVYPYPDPYTPPTVIVEPVPAAPIGVPPSYVYYCSHPAGYYPYVPQCYGAWQRSTTTVFVSQPPVVQQPLAIAPPPQPMPIGGQRELDDRELNKLAVEFQNVNLLAPNAHAHLKSLEKKVEAFRQTLYGRDYNAMDILRDADGLEHRIAEQREKLQ